MHNIFLSFLSQLFLLIYHRYARNDRS